MEKTQRIVTGIVRWIVGLFFIFSGATKLNDPIGFSIKLEEYFSPEVLNLGFLEPIALPIAVFIITLEITMGLLLLLGIYKKFTLWGLLVLDVFFTFLTFYSAYFDKVTGCGCFGDVIPLAPWQSFAKDVVLLILILILLIGQKYIGPFLCPRKSLIVVCFFVSVVLLLNAYVLTHLPIIDFLPYKTGVNISEGMSIPEDAPKAEYEITWIYKVNGKEQSYKNEDEPWNIPSAEYVDQTVKIIKEGYTPPITDFSIEDIESGDLTDSILSMDKVYLVPAPYLEKTPREAWEEVNAWAPKADAPVIVLTATSGEKLKEEKQRLGIDLPVYFTDPVTIKTMIRSWPGVMELERGTIVSKKNWRNLP